MGKRRGRRTRSDSGGRRHNLEDGFPTFRHNQWTFEGEIERLGQLARGINRSKREGGRRGTVARAWLLVLVPLAALLLTGLVMGVLNVLSLLF